MLEHFVPIQAAISNHVEALANAQKMAGSPCLALLRSYKCNFVRCSGWIYVRSGNVGNVQFVLIYCFFF
jgi:hypothetical protein